MNLFPAVSIVLPFRDAARTLARAVASVRAQTRADWELLAIDDHSSDGSAELVRREAAADPRIRLLANAGHGLVSALNIGLAQARARAIARLDADDACEPTRLDEQLRFLDAHPECGLVACQVRFGGDVSRQTGYALHVDWTNQLLTPEDIRLNRFVESPFAHPSVMFRRELIERFGGYREGDFPEDYELWLRWCEAGVTMAKLPRSLLTWYDSPGRLSRIDPRYDPEKFFATKAPYLAAEVKRQRANRALWIWGAGRPTRKRAAALEPHGLTIAGYIDIDPKKANRTIHGRAVVLPDRIPSPRDAFVIGYVTKRGARELIRAQLAHNGYREGEDFLMAG